MKKTLFLLLFSCCFLMASEGLSQNDTYSKISVSVSNQNIFEHLSSLGIGVDHIEFNDDGSVSFFVNQVELQTLSDSTISFRIEIEDYAAFYAQQKLDDAPNIPLMTRSSNVADGFDLGSMGGFYTYDEVILKLDEMKQDYPNLITARSSIGTSVEGRDIWMAKISDNPDIDENEPVAYFDALHHAREPLSMAVTVNFMFWLLENYDSDPRVQFLVDNRELYFVPVVNPDGYEFNRQTDPDGGGFWRKNRNPNDGNCFGVDLNRNYSWGYANNNSCSSPDPCSGVYRGEEAFSEPETTAVRDFVALIEPKTAFSTHSTAGSCLMPYGYDSAPPAYDIYSEWASVFLSENDYPYGVTAQMLGYTSCGVTRDYLHSENIYTWTPEIAGQGFWPPESTIFDLVAENVFPMFYQSYIAGAFVDVQSHQILGDALLGDSFEMIVEAKNVGVGSIAQDVSIEVTSNQSGITISEAAALGTINARERSSNVASPFTISVDANFEPASFVLTVTTFQEGVVNDVFEIPVYVGERELIFGDDASNGTAFWTTSGSGIQWGVVEDDAYSGTQCFGDSNGGNGENSSFNFFELNEDFDFSGTTTPAVSFVAKYSMEAGDSVSFQYSSDNGGNWISLQTFNHSESWKYYFYNLQALAGEASVKFRFRLVTDNGIPGDGFYFDDFELVNYPDGILGIEETTLENKIVLYPNPFTTQIKLAVGKGVTLENATPMMYDIQGRQLQIIVSYESGALIISGLDGLTVGVYFLRVTAENGEISTHKIIKR